MSKEQTLWRIALTVPASDVAPFEAALEPFVVTIMWTVNDDAVTEILEGYSQAEPDREALNEAIGRAAAKLDVQAPVVQVETVAPRDWVAENLKQFPPIHQGRFFIHGQHITVKPLAGRISLLIDPGAAFGTGTHATTSGCLEAIERLAKKRHYRRPLDLGTGSGILALAMAKLWRVAVRATDIDPGAVAVARDNAKCNQAARYLSIDAGPGFQPVDAPGQSVRPPFDLIVANILARPLCKLAPDIARHLEPGGNVVLSGLIVRDERMVLAAYRAQGVMLQGRVRRDGWSTLILGT